MDGCQASEPRAQSSSHVALTGVVVGEDSLLALSIRRIVPETQAAERRTWNSKPSEETSVTKGEGEEEEEETAERSGRLIMIDLRCGQDRRGEKENL